MKKRKLLLTTLFIALSALLAGCDGLVSETVMFREINVRRRVPLVEGEWKPRCKVDIEVEYAHIPTRTAKVINQELVRRIFGFEGLSLQQAADSTARDYVRAYHEELLPLFLADVKAGTLHLDFYDYEYHLNGKQKASRNGVVCYEVEVEREEGGTQTQWEFTLLNFDVETGRPITLDDMLAPGYEEELEKLILAEMMREYECETMEELRAQGILLLSDIYIPTNYRFTEDDIEFLYNPSEIGPIEEGEIDIDIPYTHIQHLLK